MKKLIFAAFAIVLLTVAVAACTNDTTEHENLYKQNIDKDKVVPPGEKP